MNLCTVLSRPAQSACLCMKNFQKCFVSVLGRACGQLPPVIIILYSLRLPACLTLLFTRQPNMAETQQASLQQDADTAVASHSQEGIGQPAAEVENRGRPEVQFAPGVLAKLLTFSLLMAVLPLSLLLAARQGLLDGMPGSSGRCVFARRRQTGEAELGRWMWQFR